MGNGTGYYEEQEYPFDFWVEGVLLTMVSVFGVVANFIAVIVLCRPKMKSGFHNLLVALAIMDMLYLFMSQLIFGMPKISSWWDDNAYDLILPFAYGFAHIGRVGSVYLTMSVTVER